MTKFGNETAILVGTNGHNDWRKFRLFKFKLFHKIFRKEKVVNDVEYFLCNGCNARAILGKAGLKNPYSIRHYLSCHGQSYAKLKAQQIDFEIRKNIREGSNENPKSLWRKVFSGFLLF